MKKLITWFVLLIIGYCSHAQNWNCFVPSTKQYFTNANNYLRGMRIDSVRTNGTDTIYYPFHTPRGINQVLDSNAGSWLGGKVIAQTDGTFLFDNIGSDTVIIKTKAGVGDSWIFYNDTSSVYYIANVASVDTATILGVLDSIKTITIATDSAGYLVSTNPISNLNIVLSKHHGFLKTFDLYLFPYNMGALNDYFFDMAQGVHGMPPYMTLYVVDSMQEFTQLSFHYPSQNEIYNYNVGDIITSFTDNVYPSYEVQSNGIDTIASKTLTSNGTSYTGHEATQSLTIPNQAASFYSYVSYGNGSFHFSDSSLLFDTTKMPEEWNAEYVYYFTSNDSSNCFVSNLYEFDPNSLTPQAYTPNLFEGCGVDINIYKVGIGAIESIANHGVSLIVDPNGIGCTSEAVSERACRKNGIACGVCPTLGLSVAGVSNSKASFEVYPNPANDELTVKMPDNTTHTISLLNMLGQTVYSLQTQQQETSISLSRLPEGVYIIKVANENGVEMSKKVIIQH